VDYTYWYLFPVAIIIANGAGIGGATFFSPLFVIALGLEPKIAIGTALITEVFGFASGVSAHYRARTIDWNVARMLLVASIPMAVIGSLLGNAAPDQVLKTILGLGLLLIAFSFVRDRPHGIEDEAIERGEGVVEPSTERVIVAVTAVSTATRCAGRAPLCRRRWGFSRADLHRARGTQHLRSGQALPDSQPSNGGHERGCSGRHRLGRLGNPSDRVRK